MGVDEHRRAASAGAPVRFSILTTSDTRTPETDASGRLARELLTAAGHAAMEHRIVANDRAAIRAAVEQMRAGADFVLVTGGTGVSPRDVTLEAVTPLFDRTLPGFGELFRALSFAEIGAAALISGATLGLFGGTLVACVPGSQGAVRLALERLIVPEIGHLVAELRKGAVPG